MCLNFMPLFHVGGICRNLPAPIFAGGSTVAMPFFDADDFWQTAVQKQCTWYYGAPPCICSWSTPQRPCPRTDSRDQDQVHRERRGPAGHRAQEGFRRRRGAHLVRYDGVHAYRVSAPGYALSGRGSGQPFPRDRLRRLQRARGERPRRSHRGQGEHRDAGLRERPEATKAVSTGGWFKTGDMGWMDADGYLYVTGRSKEVINRGGEIISPAEVEEALSRTRVSRTWWPSPSCTRRFRRPSRLWWYPRGIQNLPATAVPARERQAAAREMAPVLVLVESIPKLATGKVSRSAIAKSLDIQEIRGCKLDDLRRRSKSTRDVVHRA